MSPDSASACKVQMSPLKLTVRQKQVADSIILGLTNKEIAVRLSISEQCVKDHVSRLLRHTGVQNRTQLAIRLKPQAD